MPLTQSTLHFRRATPTLDAMASQSPNRSTVSRVSTSSAETLSVDEETIVVSNAPNPQLPTPDDSATDASSQSSRTLKIEKVSQGQAKRVTRVDSKGQSSTCLIETAGKTDNGSRNVSGQTLIPSGSESSLLRTGIDALNMQWELSRADLGLKENNNIDDDSTDTINVAAESTPSPKRPSAKDMKKQADKEREARYRAADEKATRRSSRVPLLERAGSLVAATASSLGKRSHNAVERGKDRLGFLKRTGSLRPRSAVPESTTVIPSFEGPSTKKRRLSEPLPSKSTPDAQPASTDPQVTVTKQYKHKKYLASGLYAGQPRTFSANLTGKANRRKSAAAVATAVEPPGENSILPLPMFACERLWNVGTDFRLPFDVFSPLPGGQPKPDEWRKLNKNTFVGDAAAYWRGNDASLKQFRSLCGCSEATGCDEDCQNRIMFYECNENNCSLGPKHCGNRAFADLKERVKKGSKYQIGVEVIKTPDRGYGVRSNRTFRPNQIIVEYSGEIITQEECEHRMHTDYKDNSCYYLMLFDSALIIDATVRGSIARFVNHSCSPNCRMEKWTVNGQPRMALFANGERGIMTGEELTYDYNFDPFSAKNVQVCRCGSEACRGILGRRAPGEKKNQKEDGKGVLAGAKRKLQAIIDETMGGSNNTNNKKQKKTSTPAASVSKPASKKNSTTRVVSSPAKRTVSFTASSVKKTPKNAAKISKSKIDNRIKTPGAGKKNSLKGLLGKSR